MSATRILGQSVPCLLNAFAGWKQPVHCRLLYDIGASGAVTAVTGKSTPGVTLARASAGIYTISFPACRDFSGVNIGIRVAAPETASNVYYGVVENDDTLTLASLGTIQFRTIAADDGVDEDPENGSRFDINLWLDLG